MHRDNLFASLDPRAAKFLAYERMPSRIPSNILETPICSDTWVPGTAYKILAQCQYSLWGDSAMTPQIRTSNKRIFLCCCQIIVHLHHIFLLMLERTQEFLNTSWQFYIYLAAFFEGLNTVAYHNIYKDFIYWSTLTNGTCGKEHKDIVQTEAV